MHRCTIKGTVIGEGCPVALIGVINCSPESFFPGSYPGRDIRVRAETMIDAGASVIDIGTRSTAPRVPPVSEKIERERMEKALKALDGSGITVSVDTTRPGVLETCLSHDIHAINDIGGLSNPAYAELAAGSGLPAILMASRNSPGDATDGDGTMDALRLVQSRCRDHGIGDYILDPGIGLWTPDRTMSFDWELCRSFEQFLSFDRPLLAAISRKTFLSEVSGRSGPEGRLPATLALTMMLLSKGASAVRTHDVRETADVIGVYRKWSG
jgi:dihydropteroate synthase